MSLNAGESIPQTWLYDKKNGFIALEKPSSAFLYYRKKRVNLCTGDVTRYCFSQFRDRLARKKLISNDKTYHVYHLFYESAPYFQNDDFIHESFEGPLAVEINYKKSRACSLPQPQINKRIRCKSEHEPSFQDYQEGFDQIQKHLHRGDAYQVNYTWPFLYRFKKPLGVECLLSRLWQDSQNIGAFAHASWLPSLGLLLVSNSPECLFQARLRDGKALLESMPIKGTVTLNENDDVNKAWIKLRNSVKERAELNMITDLMRNDLSRIELPRAIVEKKAIPLRVPGLLHQYSKVSVELCAAIKLGRVLQSIFPGGSVTGAPKKRVQEIIDSVEKSPRGFYCGSTLVLGPKISAASINIRSGEYWSEQGLLKLHAGGAVTLGSGVRSEYEEMHSKAQSFCRLLEAKTHREKYNNFGRLVF